MVYACIISYSERSQDPKAIEGTTSIFVRMPTFSRKDANCAGPTSFIRYADAQWSEGARAPAMDTVGSPGHSRLAGTHPLPSKYWAWLGIPVVAVKPRSSMALQYN